MQVSDLARLYRLKDWLHFLPLPLAGWIATSSRTTTQLVGSLAGWACALAYTSAVNQAFDDRLDRATPGKNPVGRTLTRATALRWAVAPLLATFAFQAALAPGGLIAALAQLLAATLYSAPPRLKAVPVVGTFWNLLVGLPGLFFASTAGWDWPPLRLLVVLFALTLLVSQLIHEAEDRVDDAQAHVRTVAVLTGSQGALGAATVVLPAVPGAAILLAAPQGRPAWLVAVSVVFATAWILVLTRRLIRRDNERLRQTRLRYRYAAFVYGAAAFALVVL